MDGNAKLTKWQSKYYNTACLMNEALIALLDKKEYCFVTVKEICQKAGVNRTTFYLHYETMDDLLAETLQYVGEKMQRQFAEQNISFQKDVQNAPLEELCFITPKYLLPYLQFVKQNKKVYVASFNQPNIMKTPEISQRMYQDIFEPIIARFNVPEKYRKYLLTFYLTGVGNVVMQWVKNNFAESEQEIAQLIMHCVNFGVTTCQTGQNL